MKSSPWHGPDRQWTEPCPDRVAPAAPVDPGSDRGDCDRSPHRRPDCHFPVSHDWRACHDCRVSNPTSKHKFNFYMHRYSTRSTQGAANPRGTKVREQTEPISTSKAKS